jgi:hypothetical protein
VQPIRGHRRLGSSSSTASAETPSKQKRRSHRRRAAHPRRAAIDPHLQRRIQSLLEAVEAARDGDFSARAPAGGDDTLGLVATALNEVIARNEEMTRELLRLSHQVGREGDVEQRASLHDSNAAFPCAARDRRARSRRRRATPRWSAIRDPR